MSDLDKESKELFSTNPLKGKKTLQRMKNVVREAPIIGTALDVVDIKGYCAGNWKCSNWCWISVIRYKSSKSVASKV